MKALKITVVMMLALVIQANAQRSEAISLSSQRESIRLTDAQPISFEQQKPTKEALESKIVELEKQKESNAHLPGFNAEAYDVRINRLRLYITNNY
jgi:hypothetical protein